MDRTRITGDKQRSSRKERREKTRRFLPARFKGKLAIHPLFFAVGIWYCFTGELLLFLMSCLVAVQHECAHAFSAARLGYKLDKIVLMPFGAVIDGDLQKISLKDEISVALAGPLCNLFTAAFFAAIWWFEPTVYAFTDTACYSSLSIALVNLLPAYPLDGGRILRCFLARTFLKSEAKEGKAEKKALLICRVVTLIFALAFLLMFILFARQNTVNFSLLTFAAFLALGAFGNRDKTAVYQKLDLSFVEGMKTGVEIRRVAVLKSCFVKDAFKYIARGYYLVLEVYDEQENHLFNLSQNELSKWFVQSGSPYDTLEKLAKNTKKSIKWHENS